MERKKFIKDFMLTEEPGYYGLSGEGGTGKSTCIKKIVKNYDASLPVSVVTYTHAEKNRLIADGVHAVTAHAYLDSQPQTNFFAANSEVAERFKYSTDKIKAHTVIVDEYSMMPKDMLRAIKRTCYKLLLVGDEAQLPPVKNLGLTQKRLKKKSIMYYSLTKNFRQTDPELLERCRDVRSTGNLLVDTENIEEKFLSDPSEDKVFLTYKNMDVERISNKLSPHPEEGLQVITHTGFEFWTADESLYFDPIFNGDRLIIKNILYFSPSLDIGGHTPFNHYRDLGFHMVTFEGVNTPFVPMYMGTMKSYRGRYIDPAFKELKELAAELADTYGLTGTPFEKNDKLWDLYRNRTKRRRTDWQDLKDTYKEYKRTTNVLLCTDSRVCTVHKAQGLGFDNVYINKDGLDAKQSYVAITRSQKNAYVGSLNNDT